MKKTIAYFIAAVFLGVALILTPLHFIQEIKPTTYFIRAQSRGAENYEHLYPTTKLENLINEFMVPAVSLVVASVGYVVLKRKTTSHKPK